MLLVDPAEFVIDGATVQAAAVERARALAERQIAVLERLAEIGIKVAQAAERHAAAQAGRPSRLARQGRRSPATAMGWRWLIPASPGRSA